MQSLSHKVISPQAQLITSPLSAFHIFLKLCASCDLPAQSPKSSSFHLLSPCASSPTSHPIPSCLHPAPSNLWPPSSHPSPRLSSCNLFQAPQASTSLLPHRSSPYLLSEPPPPPPPTSSHSSLRFPLDPLTSPLLRVMAISLHLFPSTPLTPFRAQVSRKARGQLHVPPGT